MAQITYFSIGASLNQYYPAAYSYISFEKDRIIDVANKIGLPISTAIAGAMAEEFSSQNLAQSQATDFIARYYIPLIDLIMAFSGSTSIEGIDWNTINLDWNSVYSSLKANEANYSSRTNQDWIDDYNYVVTNNIDVTQVSNAEKYFQKFVHPALNDFGPANFNLATAIRLINDTPANLLTTLGLSGYQNNYSQLAIDLSKDEQGITAKLYGLMIKEADTWFAAKNAYGGDWVALPQEIKDALYITYVNLGHDKMEQRYNEATANGTLPFYEPLPAVDTAGGLNHLYNSTAIATTIGATDYGIDNINNFIYDSSTWLQNAKLDSDLGAAYREALIKLWPFVVIDGSYDGGAGVKANFTDEYLQDRTDMLAWKMNLRHQGNNFDANILHGESSILTYYEDLATQQSIVLGTTVGAKMIFFGGNGVDTINGDSKGDHLYGGAGNDTLSGNGGNDYLEGGEGDDTYIYTTGDGFDAIVDLKAA